MLDDKLAIFSSATDREEKTVKSRKLTCVVALMLFAVPTALATTTFYVNGLTGNDRNNCLSASTAYKTIGHAILRAASSNRALPHIIIVAAATYTENLTIPASLNLTIVGSSATSTIVNGGRVGPVVSISSGKVTLSGMTFRNGLSADGGGIANGGTLTLNNSIVSGNTVDAGSCGGGGGIYNSGRLVIDNSTISGNAVNTSDGSGFCFAGGGGIANTTGGAVTIQNSTISGNRALLASAIKNSGGTAIIINSTVSGNRSPKSVSPTPAIYVSKGGVRIYNGTISGNVGGGIWVRPLFGPAAARLQNSIVAKNSGANLPSPRWATT